MPEDPNADPLNHLFFRATMALLAFLAVATFAWCIAVERERHSAPESREAAATHPGK